jgi:hypothetical protein
VAVLWRYGTEPEVWAAAVGVLTEAENGGERVYRVVGPDGKPVSRAYGSGLKGLYPTEGRARLARQHYPTGARVQWSPAVWLDT